jgi:hypothetical protein
MKHTPGPWKYIQLTQKVIARSVGGCNLEESDHMIADIRGWGHLAYLKDGAEIQDANGLLIAAAPELLEALKAARSMMAICAGPIPSDDELQAIEWADTAIDKATGEKS